MNSLDLKIERAGADVLSVIDKEELKPFALRPRNVRRTRGAVALAAAALVGLLGIVYVSERPQPSARVAASDWSARVGDFLADDAVQAGSFVGWALVPVEHSATINRLDLAGTIEVRLRDDSGGELLVSLRLNDPGAAALESQDTTKLLAEEGDRRVYLRALSLAATAVELYRSDTILYARWESKSVTPDELAQFALQLDALWRTTADRQFETRSTLMVELPKADI